MRMDKGARDVRTMAYNIILEFWLCETIYVGKGG